MADELAPPPRAAFPVRLGRLLRRIIWHRWFVVAGSVLFIGLACLAWPFFFSTPPRGPIGEEIGPDESLYYSQLLVNSEHIVNNTRNQRRDGLYRRDAHAKAHGCVAASFTVNRTFDRRLLYGLFTAPRTYKAWIRFSSGDNHVQNDWLPDARGMAVKVLGVPGKKLLDTEENATTQDFVMINYPVFFLNSLRDYEEFTRVQSQDRSPMWWFVGGVPLPSHRGGMLNPLNWHIRELRPGLGVLGMWPPWRLGPRNLLATRFYSMTAYRLGDSQFMKYSAKPVPCVASGHNPFALVGFGENALHDSLKKQLQLSRRYCFDFMVQLQVVAPGVYMPIEDPTIEWKESESPFIPVARIEISTQDIDAGNNKSFCENLSFTPWHSLREHEPVGRFNRVRKPVYQSIARYRRCMNGVAFGEPTDDGYPTFTTEKCLPGQPVPPIPGADSKPVIGTGSAQ